MSKSDTFENDLLKLIFQAATIATIARDDAGGLANLYVSLHTSDPAEAEPQTTGEIAYTNYARVPVARTAGGWTVTGNSVSPVADIVFAAYGGGAGGTVTHVGVGTLASGAGKLLYSGTLTPNVLVGVGVTPRVLTTSTITEG